MWKISASYLQLEWTITGIWYLKIVCLECQMDSLVYILRRNPYWFKLQLMNNSKSDGDLLFFQQVRCSSSQSLLSPSNPEPNNADNRKHSGVKFQQEYLWILYLYVHPIKIIYISSQNSSFLSVSLDNLLTCLLPLYATSSKTMVCCT